MLINVASSQFYWPFECIEIYSNITFDSLVNRVEGQSKGNVDPLESENLLT